MKHPDDIEPWEKLQAETAKQFAAFALYRDMDPFKRSIVAAAKAAGRPGGVAKWREWSVTHSWVARTEAYDRFKDDIKRRHDNEEIAKMNTRHANAAMQIIGKALQRLIGEKDADGNIKGKLKLEDISAADLVRMLTEGAKIERVARGEPETISHVDNTHRFKPSEDRLSSLFAALDDRLRADEAANATSDLGSGEAGDGLGLALPSETGTATPET